MKPMNADLRTPLKLIIFLLLFTAYAVRLPAQTVFKQSGSNSVMVAGTSTLHNWEMKSGDVTIEAIFKTSPEGKPIQLEALKVNIPAETLKSGKGSMDKNAYSSLKTEKFKVISFNMTSSKMESGKIICNGSLSIAGVTQKIDLEVTGTIQPDNSIQCKGEKKIKMTDFKVDPPSFMMGTIKTGDEITISLDVHLAPVKL